MLHSIFVKAEATSLAPNIVSMYIGGLLFANQHKAQVGEYLESPIMQCISTTNNSDLQDIQRCPIE